MKNRKQRMPFFRQLSKGIRFRRTGWMTGILCCMIVVSFEACREKQTQRGNTIRIEEEMAAPGKMFKVSDYFSSVRYVPLETTDSSLVGEFPIVTISKGRAYVCSVQRPCLVFDANTGKFIRALGIIDKGPGGYRSSVGMWIQPETGELYFPGWNNNYIRYSSDGKFIGELKLPEGIGEFRTLTYIDGQHFMAYCQAFLRNSEKRLVGFDDSGSVLYSVDQPLRFDTLAMTEIKSISVNSAPDRIKNAFGLSAGALMMAQGTDKNKEWIVINEQPVFWHYNGGTYFKESFCDTVFRITSEGAVPDRIFDMGKYRLLPENSNDLRVRRTQATVNQVGETDRFLIFTYFLRPEEEYTAYRGFYDKKTGKLEIAEMKGGFTDDLNHFMPLNPVIADGENAGVDLLQPLAIQEWIETHSEEVGQLKPEIRTLENLKEDDNPVLVILQ